MFNAAIISKSSTMKAIPYSYKGEKDTAISVINRGPENEASKSDLYNQGRTLSLRPKCICDPNVFGPSCNKSWNSWFQAWNQLSRIRLYAPRCSSCRYKEKSDFRPPGNCHTMGWEYSLVGGFASLRWRRHAATAKHGRNTGCN